VQLAGKLHVARVGGRRPRRRRHRRPGRRRAHALGWNERTSVEAVTLVLDAATDADSRRCRCCSSSPSPSWARPSGARRV
jgi:Holliday junction DNA helicase RuvA